MLRQDIKMAARAFLKRVSDLINPNTNPDLMNDIFKQLNLDNFSARDDNFSVFLEKIRTVPVSMEKFIEKINHDLVENECTRTLLAYLQNNALISDEELQNLLSTLQLQINLLCLLEAFTVTMLNSDTLAEDVYAHVIHKRLSSSTGSPWSNLFFGLPKKTPIFERLKIISVEPPMLSIVFHRSTRSLFETNEHLLTFIDKYKLTSLNANIGLATNNDKSPCSVAGMGINIIEANWEDATNEASKHVGGIANAMAGFGLIALMEERQYLTGFEVETMILPQHCHTSSDEYVLLPGLKVNTNTKKISKFDIDKEWRDLYNSWNLRFVLANIDTVFVPLKLLLPSVFSAQPDNYKEARTVSLFLVANLFINEHTHQNSFFQCHYKLKHADAILTQWGMINHDYAARMLNHFCPDSTMAPEDYYHHVFADRPTVSLAKNLLGFVSGAEKHRITKNLNAVDADTFFFIVENEAEKEAILRKSMHH